MLNRRRFISSCVICATAGFAATDADAQAPAPAATGITRTVLGKTDLPGDKYVTILMTADLEPGFLVPRHTHPGIESSYVASGGGILLVKGQADRTLQAADGFQIAPEVPHAFKTGAEKTRLAITYVVEKDKQLATPAPE
ncbi:cupin domain-containing protein [Xanthobacter oligotrophicus]|uniref:Cupin domain-containing protein n=1 Tax=Xanthobacter oligotrophicus TaxID=2607286 RepID=A0ABW6ZQS7_9HYPH